MSNPTKVNPNIRFFGNRRTRMSTREMRARLNTVVGKPTPVKTVSSPNGFSIKPKNGTGQKKRSEKIKRNKEWKDENGNLHRNDGPALILHNGDSIWYKNGVVHRDGDLPAATTSIGQFWYKEGKYHRDGDKPAIVYKSGNKQWYTKGLKNRDRRQPAVVDPLTGREYWVNGEKI